MTRRYKPNRKYKSRRKQRNSKKGGQFLRAGTTGCVFRPNLRCKDGDVRDDRYVSKLMDAGRATHEYESTKFLKAFDADNKYFVYPTEVPCLRITPEKLVELNREDDLKHETLDLKNCGLKGSTLFDVLKMPYGGEDLESVFVYNNELFLLLQGLYNVFEGLLLLQNNGYMHNDIKDKNVVAAWQKNGSFNVRIIDFGETKKVNSGSFHIWDRNDYFWPYDFRLYRKNKAADDDDAPYPWLLNPRDEHWNTHPVPEEKDYYKYTYYSMRNYIGNIKEQGFPFMFLHAHEDDPQSEEFASNLKARIDKLPEDAQNKLLWTCETYSLGITIYKLYSRITEHKLSDVTTLEVHQESTNSLVEDNLSRPLFDLILQMCNVDPFKRLTLKGAYIQYKSIIESAKKKLGAALPLSLEWRKNCIINHGAQRTDFYPEGKNNATPEGCVSDGGCWGPEPPGGGPWCYKPAGPRK
jgi:serine/threonine protein kinase